MRWDWCETNKKARVLSLIETIRKIEIRGQVNLAERGQNSVDKAFFLFFFYPESLLSVLNRRLDLCCVLIMETATNACRG